VAAGPRILLLTGAPGVGKTTLVRRAAEGLSGLRVAGFTTEEIRDGGRRRGFRVAPRPPRRGAGPASPGR